MTKSPFLQSLKISEEIELELSCHTLPFVKASSPRFLSNLLIRSVFGLWTKGPKERFACADSPDFKLTTRYLYIISLPRSFAQRLREFGVNVIRGVLSVHFFTITRASSLIVHAEP